MMQLKIMAVLLFLLLGLVIFCFKLKILAWLTSGTVNFRFGKAHLKNLICVSSKQAFCRVVNLMSRSLFLSFFSPTVFDGNKWCFCFALTRQYSFMVKNLEIKPSFFYFPHGIHRLHIDLKMTHILVFVSRLLCHEFYLWYWEVMGHQIISWFHW